MKRIHQLLAYADDVNLMCDDIRTMRRNANVLLNIFKVKSPVNTGKTKYIEVGRHWEVMANELMTIGNNSFKKEKTFKYLGSLVTNLNSQYF